jgi:hypothetical protein
VRTRVTVLLLFLAVTIAACGDDDDAAVDDRTTTTSTSTTTTSTSTPSTTSTTEAPTRPAAEQALWPVESSTVRYSDPVEAARGFAVELARFNRPIVGTFRAGDNRSGEVEVRAAARGPVTTVLLRRLGSDDSWWVIGATTPNIELDAPAPGSTVSSPLRLSGRARAFEGTVNVALREDGNAVPLAAGFVTGSGGGQLGPFTGEIAFSRRPAQARGTLVLFTESAENGQVWEAVAIRVGLSGG